MTHRWRIFDEFLTRAPCLQCASHKECPSQVGKLRAMPLVASLNFFLFICYYDSIISSTFFRYMYAYCNNTFSKNQKLLYGYVLNKLDKNNFWLWVIEYRMLYWGPGFIVWLLAHPLPPSSLCKIDRRHRGRLRKSDNLLRERGFGRNRIIRLEEILVWPSIKYSITLFFWAM